MPPPESPEEIVKNIMYAAIAASVGMLLASGLVAYALAGTVERNNDADTFVSEVIELHYQAAVNR